MKQGFLAAALFMLLGGYAFAAGSYQVKSVPYIVKTVTDANGTKHEQLEPMMYDVPPGSVVQYDINVSNHKKRPLNEIKVIFHIPDGSTFLGSDLNETVYVTQGEEVYPEGDLRWTIPTIPVDGFRTMSYRIKTGER